MQPSWSDLKVGEGSHSTVFPLQHLPSLSHSVALLAAGAHGGEQTRAQPPGAGEPPRKPGHTPPTLPSCSQVPELPHAGWWPAPASPSTECLIFIIEKKIELPGDLL